MADPKIRFKRDDGSSYPDWDYKRFGDLYKKVIEKNDLSFGRDKIISVANMYYKEGDDRDSLDDDYMKSYNIMRVGDIAFEGNKSKKFAHGRFVENTIGNGIVSHVFDVFRPINPMNLLYWKEYINYEPIMGKILLKCTKSSTMMTNLVAEDFLSQRTFVPCEEEQKKIAEFLLLLDEAIMASEAEVQNLEMQKKAVMMKIFSQEVRFKQEDGTDFLKWEEQPFEKVFEPLNNNTFSRDMLNYCSGPALNIHYGDILVKYGDVCDVDKDVLPFVNDGQDVTKYAFLRDGDIVLADTAEDEAVGKTIEVINTHDRIVVSGLHTMACRPRIVFSLKYLGYYMNSPEFHDQLRPYIQGIKVSSIGRKNISGILIKYPLDLEEQRLIADFFSNFDDAIAAAKKELELWKELKKGLLQQMFV